jgi:PAS domain S-box-containing protein
MARETVTAAEPGTSELVAAVDAAPVGLVAVDDDGRIVEVNSRLVAMLGYARTELIGRRIEVLVPERSGADHVRLREEFAEDPKARPMGAGRDLYARHAGGGLVPVEIALEPLPTPQGALVLAMVVDISERQAAETAFRLFFDASPYGQLLVDQSGRIMLANRALREILGYRVEALVDRPLAMLLPERHRVGHDQMLRDYFDDPQPRMMGSGRDLTARHADGSEVPVEVGLSWLPWAGEGHAVATVADISARARLELQLRRANASLEEFLYVASHDLRSPLRGIRDLLDWVREDLGGGAGSDVLRNLDRIEVRIDRMQALMDALLAYARTAGSTSAVTAGNRSATGDLTTVDVRDVVRAVLELDPVPTGFDVRLEVAVEPFRTVHVPFETVLRNLIGNAVKHHDRDHGVITITARADGTFCRVDVTDDGPGVPPAAHDRIFRLFQTLSDDGPTRSGIGLALVKRLVGAHGGRIEVISAAGERGATFRVWWPRIPRRDLHES